MSGDVAEKRCRRGLLPVPLRIPLPNPLAWRPPLLGLVLRRKGRKGGAQHFAPASASAAALGDSATSLMPAPAGMAAASPAAAPPAPSRVPLKPASDVLAGALARAASQSTIHPLDTLKVRLQTAGRGGPPSRVPMRPSTPAPAPPPPGLSKIGQLVPPPVEPPPAAAASFSSGIRLGGGGGGSGGALALPRPGLVLDAHKALGALGSLYRGVVGAASGAGIAIGAYFAFYGVACNALSRHTDLPPASVAFVGGGLAAVGSSFVKVPLAVCIRSVQAGVYPNVFSAARSITTAAGPRGLFTGYLPTVLEDVPDMAIKFAAYESMRQLHRAAVGGRPASVHEDFAMGAIAGALAAAATTPLDVIKTNMMCNAAQRPSMLAAAAAVAQQGGPRAFFRGVGARSLSNGINSAVFFCFFEAIRGAFAAHKVRSHPPQPHAGPTTGAGRPAGPKLAVAAAGGQGP